MERGHNGGRDGHDTPWKGAIGSQGVVHHRRGRGCGMRDGESADTEDEMARSRMRNIGRCDVVPFRDLATFVDQSDRGDDLMSQGASNLNPIRSVALAVAALAQA